MILMVCIVRPRVSNIVQYLLAIQPQPLSDRQQSHRSESTLSVNVKTLPLPSAHINRKLTCYCERMADLRLSCPELAEKFGDRSSLDTTAEERIKVLRASGDMYELGSSSVNLCSTLKA